MEHPEVSVWKDFMPCVFIDCRVGDVDSAYLELFILDGGKWEGGCGIFRLEC